MHYIFSNEDWLEKIVTNPITHRQDKVKSLSPEMQEMYRPKNKKTKTKFTQDFSGELQKLQELQKLHDEAHKKVFDNHNENTMDVGDYHSNMATHNVVSKVDPKFKGKISKKGELLTTQGKKLDKSIGTNVKMNENYDPKTDEDFYCKSINKYGNEATHYTKDYLKRHKHVKFAENKEFGDIIDTVRDKVSTDLQSKNPHKQLLALMVTLCDQAYFRIGNRKSEKDGVYGLHNLKKNHVSFDEEGNIHFEYIGKDKIAQHQTISPDDHVRKLIKNLLKGKTKDDHVFTHKGRKLDPETINNYVKKTLGTGVTIHRFRTYHASRIMNELLNDVPDGASPSEVKEKFNSAANFVAKKMGHEKSSTTLENYIDHNITLGYFKKHGVEAPKELLQLAKSRFMMKAKVNMSEIDRVVSNKKVTQEDINFINWMDGMVFDDKKIDKTSSIKKISVYLNKK